MIALVLFVALCAAGIVYLLWFLGASDQVAARKLATQQNETVPLAPERARVS